MTKNTTNLWEKCRFLGCRKIQVWLKQGKKERMLLDHYDHEESITAWLCECHLSSLLLLPLNSIPTYTCLCTPLSTPLLLLSSQSLLSITSTHTIPPATLQTHFPLPARRFCLLFFPRQNRYPSSPPSPPPSFYCSIHSWNSGRNSMSPHMV